MKSIFGINSPFVIFAEKLFDCMLLSVLWILFSLPVFTIGASSAALYNTANKYLRKNKGKLIKTFWNSFKENFKRSTLIWLISMAVMALLSIDVIVFRNLKIKGEPLGTVYWLALFLFFAGLTWLAYLSAYSANFNGSIKDVIKFSSVLLIVHPIKSLGVSLPIICAILLGITVPGLIIFLPAAVFWVISYTLECIFMLHMRPEDIEKINNEDKEDI